MIKRIIKAILKALKWYLLIPPARVIGRLRRTRQIIDTWPAGGIPLGPRIVLFMHYDGRGFVRRQLLEYMRDLRDNGRDVVFVSNAGRLLPDSRQALEEICAGIILRRNIGYDFGAWRDAIGYLGLPRADTEEVILANDSVFGPLVPLGDTLRRLDYKAADIWGLTESWQLRYHLQSFFLAFGPAALRAPAWARFWNKVRPVPVKSYVVQRYETGVTQDMLKGGLRCAALWRYDQLIKLVNREAFEKLHEEAEQAGKEDPVQFTRKLHMLRIRDAAARRVALNPTSDLWRQLLLTGFPFIKRELLRDNPTRVEDVGDWAEVVREVLAADPEPIILDLRTMLKGGAP